MFKNAKNGIQELHNFNYILKFGFLYSNRNQNIFFLFFFHFSFIAFHSHVKGDAFQNCKLPAHQIRE